MIPAVKYDVLFDEKKNKIAYVVNLHSFSSPPYINLEITSRLPFFGEKFHQLC